MAILLIAYYLKRRWKWVGYVPVALMLVIVSTLMSYQIDFEGKGIAILSTIPPGLPPTSVPFKKYDSSLIGSSILVGFVNNF